MRKSYLIKFLRIGLLSFLTFFLFLTDLEAQFSYGYEFKPKRKRVEIPFEWQCNLIVVRIRINQSDTLNFILDTGVGMNLITDPKVAQSLGLKYIKKIDIVGAGEGDALEAMVAINNKIYMTGIKAMGQSVVALSHDVLELSNYVGMPIHGVFGYDLFRSFIVEIDFSKKIIILHHPKYYKYKERNGEKIPVIIEDGKPYIIANAKWTNEKSLPVKVILDTGAGHALSLDRATNPDVVLPEINIRSQLGRGLSGVINGSIGRLQGFQIGKYELKDVITSFPDTNSRANRIIKQQQIQRQGNVGCEILRRFTVTFNYIDNYAIFKPNKRFFSEPFDRDMTGIYLQVKGAEFNRYFVDEVEKGSPADFAGLERGDEIISINNKLYNQFNINDVYKTFRKGDGKLIKMVLKRRNEIYYTEFLLKKMI